MSIESPEDLMGMREAARVTRETLDALERRVRPGTTTGELDAIAAMLFEREGARSAPAMVYGFPGTVLISINDEIVHGIPGARVIRAGDLVKLDVTVEKDGFIADAARAADSDGLTSHIPEQSALKPQRRQRMQPLIFAS